MQILMDKLLIFICGTTYLFTTHHNLYFESIATVFTAFGFSCFLSFLNPDGEYYHKFSPNPFYYILPVIYIGLCIILPDAILFLPLIFYDVRYTRFYLLYPIGVITCLYCFPASNPGYLFLLGLQFLLMLILHHRTSQIQELNRHIRQLRDNTTEYNRILSSKNKMLLDKQDYEIYLATLKERNRIAREIHDNVGHMLSRSLLQSGALLAINKDETMTAPLHALKDTLTLAMNNIRESVHDLHDDSMDLESAIRQLFEDYKNYTIRFDFDMSRTVARNVKYCFISITKEALSNLVKHSNATHLYIVMREHPSLYQLLIEDNGTNIIQNESGIGLINMKERVDNLNGTLTISTEKGFRIFISIPKD